MNDPTPELRTHQASTARFRFRCLMVVCLIAGSSSFSKVRGETPGVGVNAGDLVRGIIADEDKVHKLDTFYLRMQGKWTRTPAGIEAERKELEQLFPGTEVTPDRFTNLRAEMTEELELAFDRSRMRKLDHKHNASFDLRIWDGTRAIIHEKHFTHEQEHYAYDSAPIRFIGDVFLSDLSWLRAGPHSFWWNPIDKQSHAEMCGLPEDYEFEGREEFRGCECYVLANRRARRRLYVGVEDRRLRGLTMLYLPRNIEGKADVTAILRRIAGKSAGEPFTRRDWADWLRGLPAEERKTVLAKVNAEYFAFTLPSVEHYLGEYREVASGFWFPMKQGYAAYGTELDRPFIKMRRDFGAIEVKVNAPLRDELFTMEMRDGVRVNDWGHDPPLFYRYKKDRTEEEWKEIVEEHEREQAERREQKAKQDMLIGKPAAEFPDSLWLNSKPLSWKALRGKVVILDFWSEWCGPCRNDMPAMRTLHADRNENGLVVIGVHTPGSDIDSVRKTVEEFDLEYPIFIDTPAPPGAEGFGRMSSWFGIRGIPHAVVVDAEGKMAGHGTLSEMHGLARELNVAVQDSPEKPKDD